MRVIIQKTGKIEVLVHEGTAESLLTLLNINPQTVLVIKDGTLITEDETVSDAQEILLLSVISGG